MEMAGPDPEQREQTSFLSTDTTDVQDILCDAARDQ